MNEVERDRDLKYVSVNSFKSYMVTKYLHLLKLFSHIMDIHFFFNLLQFQWRKVDFIKSFYKSNEAIYIKKQLFW